MLCFKTCAKEHLEAKELLSIPSRLRNSSVQSYRLSLGPILANDCVTDEPKWTIVLKQLENRNIFLLVCFSKFLGLQFSVHLPYFVSLSASSKGILVLRF